MKHESDFMVSSSNGDLKTLKPKIKSPGSCDITTGGGCVVCVSVGILVKRNFTIWRVSSWQ